MADLKISQLGSIVTVVPATDVLPVVQGGTTLKITPNQILGAGGTATLASATITGAATVGTTLGVTGDLTVDTNVLKVDTTNNRVGIATATPGVRVDIVSENNTSLDPVLRVNSNNVAVSTSLAYDGLIGSATLTIQSGTSSPIVFNTNGATERARFNSTGNLAFVTGKGIDFSAVTGGTGTATANVLNDYEEGTWQGTLSGSTAVPTTTIIATGKYTKIGRQVSVQISFIAVDTTGASGRILVAGLPFAASSSPSGIIGSVMIDLMATFTGSPGVYLTPNGTQFDLYSSVSNGAVAAVTHNAGAAKSLWLNVTYTV